MHLWINVLQVLTHVAVPHPSVVASQFFPPKSLVYTQKKQGFKRLRTNVFQEWDRGGDRPAPWEFGLFHSWRLARSFGFRVLANRWFLVSRLGLNWRGGSVCGCAFKFVEGILIVNDLRSLIIILLYDCARWWFWRRFQVILEYSEGRVYNKQLFDSRRNCKLHSRCSNSVSCLIIREKTSFVLEGQVTAREVRKSRWVWSS